MQPPGGGPPDKRKALPPPWGHPPREPSIVQPPRPGTATTPPPTADPAATAPAPAPKPAPEPAAKPAPKPAPEPAAKPAPAPAPAPSAAPVQPLAPAQTQPYPPLTRPPAPVTSPHTPPPERLPRPPQPGPPPSVAAPTPPPPIAVPTAPAPTPTPGALPLAAPPPEPPTLEDLSGVSLTPDRGILDLIKISPRRAFRLRPVPDEVLRLERAALTAAQPSITDPVMQGFLAWRRSVLLVIATLMVPLVVLRFIEVSGAKTPDSLTGLRSMTVLAETAFAVLAWVQLRHWTSWPQQRRPLAWGVAIWFAAPFVLSLVPLRDTFDRADELAGIYVGVQALFTLAPRALAAGPSVIRAALVNRHYFPELAAPGKLIAIAAVACALIAYLVLILPYQITGSGWFVVSLGGAIAAQVFLVRDRSRDHLIASAVAVLFAVIGFARLASAFELSMLTVINLALSFAVGVLAGTLVATDALMTAFDRADGPRAAPPPG